MVASGCHALEPGMLSRDSWQGFERLARDNLDDILRVNQRPVRIAKIDNHMVILRRPEVPGFAEAVLCAVGEPQHEWSKWPPFHEALDIFDFHIAKLYDSRGIASQKPHCHCRMNTL